MMRDALTFGPVYSNKYLESLKKTEKKEEIPMTETVETLKEIYLKKLAEVEEIKDSSLSLRVLAAEEVLKARALIKENEEMKNKIELMKNDMIEHMKLSAIENDTQRAVLQEREAALMKAEEKARVVLQKPKKSKSSLKKKVGLKCSSNVAAKAMKTMK